MSIQTLSQLSRTLRGRCSAIAESWYQAIAPTGHVTLSATEIRQHLVELTEQAITLLLADAFERDEAQVIGTALVRLHYIEPEALNGTQEVLARQLIEGLPADQVVALQPRLAALMGGIGAGFLRQAQQTTLIEQDQILEALVSELRSTEGALREANALLETRVKERSDDLAQVNRELRTEIAERMQAEDTLRRRAQELDALQATVLDIITPHDLSALLETIVERAARLLNAPSGGMYLCEPDQEQVRCVVSHNTPRDYKGTTLKYGEGAAGTVAQGGDPLIIHDYRTWRSRASAYEEDQPFTAVLTAPMIWQGHVIGTVDVLDNAETRRFTQADLELLARFADHAAIAVENARLHEAAQQEITERRRAEKEIRKRNRELGALNVIATVTSQSLDLNETLNAALDKALEVMGLEVGGIYLADWVFDEIRLVVHKGISREFADEIRTLVIDSNTLEAVTAESKLRKFLLSVRAITKSPKLLSQVLSAMRKEGLSLDSAIPVLLQAKDKILGLMVLASRVPRQFTEAETKLLTSISQQIAISIENAQLYEKIQQELGERMKAEQDLSEQNSLLDEIFSGVQEGIGIVDENETIIFCNPAYADLFENDVYSLLGKNLLSFFDEQGRSTIFQQTEQRKAGQTTTYEVPLITAKGNRRYARFTVSPRFTQEGSYAGAFGTAQDITERRQTEGAMRQRHRELALLNRASRALAASLELEEVIATILEEVRRLLDAVASSIWLIDTETDELVCQHATGPQSEDVRGWRLGSGQGLVGWVARSDESLIVADTLADERHFAGVDQQTGLALRSILSVPLRAKENVIGVIQVLDLKVNRFRARDQTLLESLAATAAVAIDNARLYEQARQDAETRAALLREVNHRVKNNLTAIVGLLYAERNRAMQDKDAVYKSVIQDLLTRVQGLSTVHSLLSASQWAPLRLSDLAVQIIHSSLQMLPRDKHVVVEVPYSSVRVTADQAHNLALVINELTTNTVKYALLGQDTARIVTRIEPNGNTVKFEFRDDGPGYPEEVLRMERHNVGFELVQNIVRKDLRGELNLYNDHGTVAVIEFPARGGEPL